MNVAPIPYMEYVEGLLGEIVCILQHLLMISVRMTIMLRVFTVSDSGSYRAGLELTTQTLDTIGQLKYFTGFADAKIITLGTTVWSVDEVILVKVVQRNSHWQCGRTFSP